MTLMDVAAEAAKAKYPTGVDAVSDGFEPLTPTETSVRLVLQEGFTMGYLHLAKVMKSADTVAAIKEAFEEAEKEFARYTEESLDAMPKDGDFDAWEKEYPHKELSEFTTKALRDVLDAVVSS